MNGATQWARPKLWATLAVLMGTAWTVAGRDPLNVPAPGPVKLTPPAPRMPLASSLSPLRPGALATGSLHLVGLRLAAPSNRIDVPIQAPFSVPVGLWIGDHQASAQEAAQLVPADATLTGTLTGPGFSAPLQVSGSLTSGLSLPGLPSEGDFTLSNIRLVKGGTTVLQADPATVAIHCLGEVIISSVTSTPMTMQEIRDSGIQLAPGNYEGRRFTMALSIGSRQVNLAVPVAVPVYNGLEDPRAGEGTVGRLEIQDLGDERPLPDLSVVVADIMPEKDPFALSRPAISHTLRHNFKALIVIPGSIGYLHQFYKVNLVVFNSLAEGSPFKITHLTTTLNLPRGADGAVGTADDPLRTAQRDGESDAITKPVLGAGANLVPGTGEPVLKAGETGMATFFVEALKEGAHQLNFDIRGQFEGGGLSEPVPLLGHAQGKVLVRNPNFNLVLVHPDVVRQGEEYTLEARLTNTSDTLANGVTVALDRARLGSVKLVEDLNTPVDTLKPGDTAVFKWRLRALRNGEIRSSYLYMEQGTIGFQLSTGLGERNIRLNPDTLVLPQTLEGRKGLPSSLREAMLRVLGQAYSIASSKGALPPGVLPIAMSSVTGNMGRDLSEQGLFLKMGVDKARIWTRLWELFMQNPDPGFDQLVRTTDAGHQLRTAFLDAWTWADDSHALTERLPEMAPWATSFGAFTVAAIDGAQSGVMLDLVDASGNRIASPDPASHELPSLGTPYGAWGASSTRQLITLPSRVAGARLRIANRGNEAQELKLATLAPVANGAPTANTFDVVVMPGQLAVLDLGGAREGAGQYQSVDGAALGGFYASQTSDLLREPFKVLAVHRYDIELDASASPYGTHVMMLFNRATMPLNLPAGEDGFNQAKALVDVDANAPWKKVMAPNSDGEIPTAPPALFKAYPRVASYYLERPVGPYVARYAHFGSGWTDADGQPLSGELSWPIACGDVPGGALVRGKVRKVTGEGLPAKLTYWYQASSRAGNVDLATGFEFLDEDVQTHYALVTNLQTEPDGTYQLDYVPEPVSFAVGPMLLQGATAQGTAWGQASVLGNGQLIEMDLVLEGKGSVDGYVLDAQGAPVAGASVQVIQEQPSNPMTAGTGGGTFVQSATTDANGFYRVDNLKTGVFSIRALKGLFGAAASNEISRDGELVHQNVVLQAPTGTIRARLLDLAGQPLFTHPIRLGIAAGLMRTGSSATSFIYPDQAFPAVGGDGWVTFQGVPAGDVALIIPDLALGTATDWKGFLDPGATQEVTLRLLPQDQQGFAHFTVRDASGKPVPGVYLYVGASDMSAFGITDENGAVPKRPVPVGPNFSVWAYHPAWVGRTQSAYALIEPGQDSLVAVTMPPRGALHGRVTREDGSAVQGAYVAIPPVFDDMKRNRLAISDATGAFLIPNVPVGTPFRLAAVGPDLRTAIPTMTIQVAEGQDLGVDLTLPLVGRNQVNGIIYQPLEGSQLIPAMAQIWVDGLLPIVHASSEGNASWGLLARETTGATSTGPEGKFSFTGLPQGTYNLHANSDLFPVEVKSTGDFTTRFNDVQTRTLFLTSSFAGELKGVIYQRDGQTPVPPDVRVRLIGGSIGELIVHTVADGKYKFPKVIPEGCYKLRVEDPFTGDIATAEVVMTKESSQARNLRLWGKGTLTVHVQDSFGQTLPEGVVTLTHSKGGSYSCAGSILEADDLPPLAQKLKPEMEGRLVFEDLLEGPISVTLKNPTGLQGTASVTLPEGGGDAEVVVRLQPVGDILGMLYRADGTLVSAGRVDAYQNGKWLGVSPTRMDGVDGRFRFGVLPTGVIHLEAWDPDSRQTGKATVNVVAGTTTEVTLTTHDKGPVVVTVTQEDQAVAGAAISLSYRGGDALTFGTEGTSDSTGKATFYLPPGDYSALATDPVSLATGSTTFSRDVNQPEIQASIALKAVRSLWATALPPPGAPAGYSLEGWSLRDTGMGRQVQLDARGQGMLPDLTVGLHTLRLTDLRGRDRGTFQVTLSADGGAVQASPGLTAVAYGQVDLTVVDAQGQPATGIMTYLTGGGGIRTDNTGLARYLNLRAGTLNASAAGASGTVILRNEGETVTLQLQLPPIASVHGTVLDPLGLPVPYVLVSVGPQQTATDANGLFRVNGLGLGTYTALAVSNTGRRAAAQVVLSQPGQDQEVILAFPPQGRLTGTVRDPLRPVPPPVHVMVYLATGGNPVGETTTNDQGLFVIGSLPAGVGLRVKGLLDDGRTEVINQTFTLDGMEGASLALEFSMPALVNVKGWTLDARGNKIPMTVLLQDDQGRTLDKAVTTGDLFDPDHPTFFFHYLVAGRRYRLLGLQEMTSTAIAYLDFTPAGDAELVELTLQAQVRGGAKLQLRYPDGSAAPGPGRYTVVSQSALGGSWTGDLAMDGSAQVASMPEGPATVSLTGVPNQPALTASFTVVAQATPVEVPVPAVGLGTLSVSVRTTSGRLLSGGTVTARAGSSPVWTGLPQADGTYRIEGAWVGYSLTFTASGFGLVGSSPAATLTQHGQVLAVAYPAPDQGSLQGVVRDYLGAPVAGVVVSTAGKSATSDATGTYRLSALPLGSYALTATVPGRVDRGLATGLLATDGQTLSLDVALKGTGTVTVKATKADGTTPLTGVSLSLTTTSPWTDGRTLTVPTDINGIATFLNVLEGDLRVSGSLLGSAQVVTGTLPAGGSTALSLKALPVSVAVSPSALTLVKGHAQTFTATVANAENKAVTWTLVEGDAGGALTASGLYTAPATPGTYHVTATSQEDPAKQATATITVPQVTVTLAPSTASVLTGYTKQLTATVANTDQTAVTWSIQEGTAGGSVSAAGLYTAPSSAGTYHVLATSVDDPTKQAVATLTVTVPPPVVVTITPASATLLPGGVLNLSSSVTGSTNTLVDWSIQEGATGGTITSSGLYTASSNPGIYHVVATSQANPSKTAVATLTVQAPAPITVTLQPSSVSLRPGDLQAFSASVSGTDRKDLTWSLREGASAGNVTASGLYSAPSTEGTYHLVATSVADPTKTAEALITVALLPPVADLSGTYATNQGSLVLYQAGTALTGTWVDGASVSHTISGTLVGSVLSGSWSAPSIADQGQFTLTFATDGLSFAGSWGRGTAQLGTTWTGTRTQGVVSVQVDPASCTLPVGQTTAFKAMVGGTVDKGVVWSATGGAVAANGVYQAPEVPGLYRVTATSVASPDKSATATVAVGTGGALAISGTYQTNAGTLVLYQNGSALTGLWTNGSVTSQVQGTLVDHVLSGSWSAPSISDAGQFELTFSLDLFTFSGAWGRGTAQLGNPWTGTRQAGTVSVLINPTSALLATSETMDFSALVAGTPDGRVTWTASLGAVDEQGHFVAPAVPGVGTVTATSVAYPDRAASATIAVGQGGFLDISGTYQTNQGSLVLYQQGDRVVGDWKDTGNVWRQVEGRIVDQVFSGTWSAPSIADQGQFVLSFSSDGASFSGSWGRGTSQLGTAWTGNKQAASLSVRISPASQTLKTGASLQLTAAVQGNLNTNLLWSVQEGPAGGNVDATGLYTAPQTPGTYHVVAAAAVEPAKTATATVVVTADGVLEVSGTYSSYSSVYGTNGDLVLYQSGGAVSGTWGHPTGAASVTATLAGRVLSGAWRSGSNSGLFVVTFAADGLSYSGSWGYGSSNGSYTWTGTRKAGVSLQIAPGALVLTPGGTQAFTWQVAGSFDKEVAWTATGGSISAQGVYVAPSTPGLYSVTATAHADATKTATAVVEVTSDGLLEVSGTYSSYSSSYGTNGDLTLFQSGAVVTGTWGHPHGVAAISATLAGRVLTGTWRVSATDAGLFVVTYAADGLSYSGSWGYGALNNSYSWSGSRKSVVSLQIAPGSAVLTPGGTQAFTWQVAGSFDKDVVWTTTGGSISAQGVYVAPSTPGLYSVTATAHADATKTATAVVEVTSDGLLEVSGTYSSYSSSYGTNGDLTLFQSGAVVTGTWGHPHGVAAISATLTGRVLTGTWRVSATDAGLFVVTYAADGLSYSGSWGYGALNNSYSWSGSRKSVVSLQIAPGSVVLTPGGTQAFTWQVAGSFDKDVVWTTTGGSISAQGVYVAPSTPGLYSVTATAHADATKTATAVVEVTSDGLLEISGTYNSYSSVYGANGDLTLFQAGGSITGTWGSPHGSATLTGTLTGRVLTGMWRVSATDTGLFVVTFAADGLSYSGSWGYGTANNSYTWSGARKSGVVSVSIQPSNQPILAPGDTLAFTGLVGGSFDKRVTWSCTAGTITGSGLFTAPVQSNQSRVAITATHLADPSKSGSANVLVAPGGVAFVSGTYTAYYSNLVLYQNGTALTGDWTQYGVTYTFQGTLDGYVMTGTTTRSDNGAQHTVKVTFAADVNSFTGDWAPAGTNWGWARQAGVTIRMSPLTPKILGPSQQVKYTAEVAGSLDKSISWTSTGGTVDDTGLYTAPATQAYSTQTITATANADTTKTLSAKVSVTPSGYLFVSGTYTAYYSNLVLYQNGTALTGDWTQYGVTYTFQGTLDGYVMTGTTTRLDNGAQHAVKVTFAADVNSFTGDWAPAGTNWGWARQAGVTLKLTPTSKSLAIGDQTRFLTKVAGTLDPTVTYSLSSANAGGVDADGQFTAGTQPGAYTLTARSLADPSKTATAKILVTDGNPSAALVAQWSFEEGSGTTAVDATSNHFNGTLANGPTWIEGRVGQGQALQFSGFTSTMDVPNATKLNPSSISLALWLYLPTDPNCGNNGNWRSLLHKGSIYGATSAYDVILEGNRTIAWDTGTGSSDRWWPAGVVVPIGRWTHLVLTYDATTGLKQAYQDGVLMDAKTLTPAPLTSNTSPLSFNYAATGACTAGYGHFDGAMDDIRIYNRTLSPSEVQSQFFPVSLTPARISLKPGATATFQAARPDGQIAPMAFGASGGTVGPDGSFTAPAQPGTYSVTATSNLDPSKPAVSTILVRDNDAAEEFTNATNPAGPWSYGWTGTLGSGFTPFVNHAPRADGVETWETWPSAGGIWHNPTPQDITISGTSPTIIYPPNLLVLHPGQGGQYAVLRWTAQESGLVDVAATFSGADSYPTTTDVHVLLNGVPKFDGIVNAFHAGPAYRGTLAVQAGDTLDLAVGGNGAFSHDSTAVTFRINKVVPALVMSPVSALLAPGASRTFSAAPLGLADGAVTWSVEEGDAGGSISADGTYTAPGLPGVYHVVATSVSDPSVSAKATVVVATTTASLWPSGPGSDPPRWANLRVAFPLLPLPRS